MLRHIVMFNWKPEVTEEQINAVAKGFAHLAEVIDVVLEMKFGKNLAIMDGCFDYAMSADFESADDWMTYRNHPEHIKFATNFASLASETARIQF